MKFLDTSAAGSSKLYTRHFLLMWLANFFITTCLGSFFLFPLFIKERGGSESDIGVLMGAITISSVLVRPWIAQIVDRFGRKRSYFVGCTSFLVLPLLFIFIEGDIQTIYNKVLIVRIIHGFGLALTFTSAVTLMADIIPPERLNEGLGMFGVTGLIGWAVGPAISEPIIQQLGFDAYFVSISLVALLSLLLQLPIPETYIPDKRLDEGVSFLSVLTRKKMLGIGILTLFFGIAMATQNSFVSPFIKEIGLSNVSFFFVSYSLAAVLSRIFGSKLGDRVGEIKVIPWAMLLIASGFFTMTLVDNLFLLILAGFITGSGHGFLFPCLNALVLRHEPVHIRGKISAIFTGSVDLGVFTGSAILGYVGEWFGYPAIFMTTCLVLILGWILFLTVVRKIVI